MNTSGDLQKEFNDMRTEVDALRHEVSSLKSSKSSSIKNLTLLRTKLGHLSAVYCVLFDRSGKYVVTGSDDFIVKLWRAVDGRLLSAFHEASADITDIDINLENTLLAVASCDGVLRVYDLQSMSVFAVLSGHSISITSVNFCPKLNNNSKYLVTTSAEGSTAFWRYSESRRQKIVFEPKPIKFQENSRSAATMCASFSPGGFFLATGSEDHHVRVYQMCQDRPKKILESKLHSKSVESIKWAHSGMRFASGSKDGTALIWRFENQQWKSDTLNMTESLETCPKCEFPNDPKKVIENCWNLSDDFVMTAVNDHSIKVWNSKTAKLHKVLHGHTNEVYVLESHPKEDHVLLSAGHDGQIILWDIYNGEKLASFVNHVEGEGNVKILDAKFSTDGTEIVATDLEGRILTFGTGSGPREQSQHESVNGILVEPLNSEKLSMVKQKVYEIGIKEMDEFRSKIRKRPLMNNNENTNDENEPPNKVQRRNENQDEVKVELIDDSEPSEKISISSDSESSDFSDWIDSEDGQKLAPPKRSNKKFFDEVQDEYPEWFYEVVPKTQYLPQIGDEVVYFRQGHERYFETVRTKNIYELTGNYEPWKQLELKEYEYCKVIGMKIENRPPRLFCLKLALLTKGGRMTKNHFTIKYHDIPGVIDFIVLTQTLDKALERDWGPGDRFRCLIVDEWWFGQIESHQALSENFPNSIFMCFKIKWDCLDTEYTSPWDMEPIDPERAPENYGDSVPALPEEIQELLYHPTSEEWPKNDRSILVGINQVMSLDIAKPFLNPIDLELYPTYAKVVEYPIDLITIRSRVENNFYRRIIAAQFDVRYIAKNAEKVYKPHSTILKNARIVTDVMLKVLSSKEKIDVKAAARQLAVTYASSDVFQLAPSTSKESSIDIIDEVKMESSTSYCW